MITSSTIPSSPSVTKSVVRRIIDYDIILYTKLYTFNIIREDNLAPSIQCNGSVWMCILRNHMMFHWHGGMMRWRIIGRWRKIHKSRWRWPCRVFACRIHLFFVASSFLSDAINKIRGDCVCAQKRVFRSGLWTPSPSYTTISLYCAIVAVTTKSPCRICVAAISVNRD